MTLLCFLLDLRTISQPLLLDLKQCLLQLANLYVLTFDTRKRDRWKEPFLRDRIALCYLHRSTISSSCTELKIAYRPGERFSICDFHHAVNCLPLDNILAEVSKTILNETNGEDVQLKTLFSNKALYSWGGDDVPKKVIVLSASVFAYSESIKKILMDAAEQCVTVEFIVLESEDANSYHNVLEKLKEFSNNICDLENCMIRSYLPDSHCCSALVKRWLQELTSILEEPLQAVLLFNDEILGSVNQIYCNLFASYNQINDSFACCQTCSCHGYPVDIAINKSKKFCPLTSRELESSELIENAVRMGEQTVFFLPSFEGFPPSHAITSTMTFNAIERTSLASISEGLVVGTSYIVTPSCYETEVSLDVSDKSDINTQIFHGLCKVLFNLDQGLICSSTCNIETMSIGTFHCYYLLQPSDRGPMLLRRLVSSEEILPLPGMTPTCDIPMPKEIENSIEAALLKIELKDYNPLHHERGFHSKLNWLIKESLPFGSYTENQYPMSPKVKSPCHLAKLAPNQISGVMASSSIDEEKTTSCTSEEWEKLLIVDEMKDCFSSTTTCISNPESRASDLTIHTKCLDEKTSRILERLEAPKQQNAKGISPTISSNSVTGQMKKPLMIFDSSSSQPMKPNFQRLRRNQR